MKKITLLLLLIANFCLAQNPTKNAGGFATITGAQTIAPSAIIEARSTTKGVLLSPMTSTQMNDIASPANGLQVTNTSDGNKPYYFDGTSWRPVSSGGGETLAETLAEDNKTNDIPIVSNNGNAVVDVNDNYLQIEHGNNTLTLEPTTDGLQLYSDIQVLTSAPEMTALIDGAISYACTSFTLNSEEVATQPYADAKVADDLTASTTVAPSKTAVNTALDLKQDKGNYRKLVAVDAGNTTHTGTLTETIVSSILIPANSLDALCDLFFSYDYEKSTGNATTIKVYKNTSNSLTGATLFASYNAGSWRNAGFFRKMLLRGTNLDTQASTGNLLNNYVTDILFVPSTVITLNPAVNNYILVTITLSNTGDVFTTKRTVLEKLNLVP